MRPVDGSPFPMNSFDFEFPDIHFPAASEQNAEMVLRLSVFFKVHILHNAMHFSNQIH